MKKKQTQQTNGRKQDTLSKFAKRELWTIYEATFLVNGLLPPEPVDSRAVQADSVKETYRDLKDVTVANKLSSYPAPLVGRSPQWLGMNRVSPAEIVGWAIRQGLPVPSELAGLATISNPEKPYRQKERENHQRIIGALLRVIMGEDGWAKHPDVGTEAKLIERLVDTYKGYGGLSKRHLEAVLPQAKRLIELS